MTVINGLGGIMAQRTAPRRPGAGGFHLPADGATGAAPLLAVGMPSLLGLQEAQGDAVSDREARRHADEMLDALRDLQRALLDGTPGTVDRLARLARHTPQAADPQLLAIQRAVALRAAVEQARQQRAAASL